MLTVAAAPCVQSSQGCGAYRLHVHALAHLRLGGWWPAAAKKPKNFPPSSPPFPSSSPSSNSSFSPFFFFFFSQIPCSMFGEGKGGSLKWLMHCSLQPECLLLNSFSLLPIHTPHPGSFSGSTASFLKTNRGHLWVSQLLLWCLQQHGDWEPARVGDGHSLQASEQKEGLLLPPWWVLKIVAQFSPTCSSVCLSALDPQSILLLLFPLSSGAGREGRREGLQAVPPSSGSLGLWPTCAPRMCLTLPATQTGWPQNCHQESQMTLGQRLGLIDLEDPFPC